MAVRMGMFGCLPKRVTCIWCSWKLARLVQRKLLSRSTDYESISFQVLKLTNKCKLEYLPARLGKYYLRTRCHVVRNEVWLCFRYGGYHSCETWTREKIRQSLNHSDGDNIILSTRFKRQKLIVDKMVFNKKVDKMGCPYLDVYSWLMSKLNSVSNVDNSIQNHYLGILSSYDNRPFAFSCMYLLSCNSRVSVFYSRSSYKGSWALQFRLEQVGIQKWMEISFS